MSDYELKRINALTEASAINDSDVFAIDSAAGTKKVAWETLKGEVDADISEAVSNKADTDGTYPDMAVGSVLGTNTVTDREPYFLRPSASIGDREFDTLVGGTLGWNQLVSTYSKAGNGTTPFTTGTVITKDHKMFLSYKRDSNASGSFLGVYARENDVAPSFSLALEAGDALSGATIKNAPANGVSNGTGADVEGNAWMYQESAPTITDLVLIDLTTLFGSTIADYIYSLEQVTAGDGVAWVRKYLPNDYYDYCAPTLKHVTGVSAHVMRDANDNVIGNYAIDSTWVGMGVPKLDSANKLYFDGDTYAADGTVTERYGIVDLGTLTWTAWDKGRVYSSGLANVIKSATSSELANIISSNYPTYKAGDIAYDESLVAIGINNTNVVVRTGDNNNPTGYLVYEKATPTTETASPFISPQICDKDGTEEYVTTGLVPVGHETEYVENLADKLTDIPDLPTTAGTYRLNVTVSGDVPSYSWVSA